MAFFVSALLGVVMTQWVNFLKRETRVKGQFGHRPSFFLSLFQMAMHGELKHWPNWIETLVHINHFALVVNSSINILIYACKDEKFLNVLLGRTPPSVRPSVFSIPFLLFHSECQPAT